MSDFTAMRLPPDRTAVAPDGSDVRMLLGLEQGGMAHFELAPGRVSKAVAHKTVQEIWYFIGGRGEMWRKRNEREEVIPVDSETCLTLPVGTQFQFRSFGYSPLAAIGVTMPPWPNDDEAYEVTGKWQPTV